MFLRCITQDMATILNSNIVAYLPKGVYLAGGSAVALYFNHRLSVDLDFFTPEEFNRRRKGKFFELLFESRFHPWNFIVQTIY